MVELYLKDPEKKLYPTVRGWLYKDKQADGYTYYEQWKKESLQNVSLKILLKKLAYKHVIANKDD
ncbi:MAG: hypothetical protein ACRCTQ_02820 [Brevinemataceae bacterium]